MRNLVMSAGLAPIMLALAACGGEPAQEAARQTAPEATPEPAVAVSFADLTGDAAAGEAAYGQCRVCHMVEEGRNGVGPSLYGVIGRKAGAIEGFRYSDANANSGVTWTPEAMFDFLENPRKFMPGTRMAFPGLKDPQARADLIAYLDATDD